jgi:hypothetical protein
VPSGDPDIVVVGQIARDLVLVVDEMPAPGRRLPSGSGESGLIVDVVDGEGRWRYLEHRRSPD